MSGRISVEELLGKDAQRPGVMSAKERNQHAREFVASALVESPDETSGRDAFNALVEAYKSGEISDNVTLRFVEEISDKQATDFVREWNKSYGTRPDDKIDNLRAAAVAYAEEVLGARDGISADDALSAIRAKMESGDAPDDVVSFLKSNNGTLATRQERKFGRDWRREQSDDGKVSAPRVNRFDDFDARLDALAQRFDNIENALSKLTTAVNKLAK
jgi:hypothetical protein